jgi:hypothetical protein
MTEKFRWLLNKSNIYQVCNIQMEKTYFNNHIAIFYYCLILSVISAIRLFGLGNDYYGYLHLFGNNSGGDRTNVEPAFKIIGIINDVLFNSSLTSFFFISSLCALLLKINAIKELVHSYFIIILFYYFITFYWIHEYTQVRAAVAIGIYFNAIIVLSKKKIIQYFIYTVIATLFHYSALVMVFFLLFIAICNTKKRCLVVVTIGFIFALVSSSIVVEHLRDSIYQLQKITGINKSGPENEFMSVFNLKYLSLLFMFFLLAFFITPSNNIDMLLFQSFAFGLCFYYYLNPINLPIISVRFAEFYTSVFIMLIPNIISKINFKEKKLLLFLFTFFVLFYSYATLKTTGIL